MYMLLGRDWKEFVPISLSFCCLCNWTILSLPGFALRNGMGLAPKGNMQKNHVIHYAVGPADPEML
jgi:hypothetical protein